MPEAAPSDRDWIAASKSFFVAKERAKRFAFRLREIQRERRLAYAGARSGMTSFADAVASLQGVEADLRSTIDDVLEGRLRDRERGETEIPLVAALESVAPRVSLASASEVSLRVPKASRAALEARVLGLLDSACARLDAFATVYDEKRLVAAPLAVDVDRVLARVEEDVAEVPGSRLPHADRLAPRVVTSPDALEDLLRAARAEAARARPPWRVSRDAGGGRLRLAIGEEPRGAAPGTLPAGGPPSAPGPSGLARARTRRAEEVLAFVHGVLVERAGLDGATTGVAVLLEDASAKAVGERVSAETDLPPHADAAVRGYLLAKEGGGDPFGPGGLVAVMGVFKAVERELERVLLPGLGSAAARLVASRVPREESRKAPVRREVAAALEAAHPAFPSHRTTDVLDAVAAGKASAATTRPPDAAVVLAVLGVAPAAHRAFTDRVLPLAPLSEEDVLASVRDVSALAILRLALERGRSPGAGWETSFEDAAFGLLRRLARVSPPAG